MKVAPNSSLEEMTDRTSKQLSIHTHTQKKKNKKKKRDGESFVMAGKLPISSPKGLELKLKPQGWFQKYPFGKHY